jgi:hypothetical protein
MKEAMDYAMNHPPGEKVSDPIKPFFSRRKLATIQCRRVSDARSM